MNVPNSSSLPNDIVRLSLFEFAVLPPQLVWTIERIKGAWPSSSAVEAFTGMGDLDGILGSGDDMVKSTNGIKMIKKVVYFALTWHAGGKGSWDLLTSISHWHSLKDPLGNE
ncbi:predicted protein [Sclerotinia sclerotiorum 1980 UF-70]|uniref:Uncharacterized protein n=1 Tax=Sclerotinia sclerotiorum (strain ATCC 18683 / 1980 / Ss-1) TaxID=665079 RepID=A7F334_SCLS1|nr:predicted protein [Sclerotinia sclerotiorum 1980 UF-70]EDN96126.1 predicted protein [Sclerotinia sclerotiorum 1980 UF-70]